MSGSSLDGLDIAYCKIKVSETYQYEILAAQTIPYSDELKQFLKDISADITKDYKTQSAFFDAQCAQMINTFVTENGINHIDFISAHGHTIYHYPENKITCQIGDGIATAKELHCPVIINFRKADIEAGGQGAPLVPIADKLFFADYDACLNIGGICNISYEKDNKRIGYDISAANQLLNYNANLLNLEYDDEGNIAKGGKVHNDLLNALNSDSFFEKMPPKSLDNNAIKNTMVPLFNKWQITIPDALATATEHIALQIANCLNQIIQKNKITKQNFKLLVTGGGAFNTFLINRIENLSGVKIQLPNKALIQFKEALAMCLMGVLKWENKSNFLTSVTGANIAVSGGEIVNLHE